MREPGILGPDGRPLRPASKAELRRRVAAPSTVGLRSARQWRSVVTDLTPDRLRSLFRRLAGGDWTPDFLELAEEVEERDAHYRGVVQQRRLAALGLAREVRAASDDPRDAEIADAVRRDLVEAPAWTELLRDLLDAVGKGFAAVEVVWRMEGGRWTPAAYERIDPRWIAWDRRGLAVPLLVGDGPWGTGSEAAGVPSSPMPPGKFVTHRHRSKAGAPARGGLAFTVASLYLLKSMAMRQWWAYSDVYGLPFRVGTYDGTADEEDIRRLEDALAALASDAAAAIPDSMRIEFIKASEGSSGAGTFESQVRLIDEQVSKAVVGQTMTADDGSSRSQATVHEHRLEELVEDDMRQVLATVSAQLVAKYCALNFAPRPAGWPRVELPEREDAIDLAGVLAAAGRGLAVPEAWLRERLGIPEPQEGEDVLRGAPGAALHAGRGLAPDAPRPDWRAVSAAVVAPLAEALEGADTPEEFLMNAAGMGVPDALAEDLALQLFAGRVGADAG